MNLATHQQAMLRLMRVSDFSQYEQDPYIQRVAQSRDLLEARNNVFLWRAYVLARTAPLTFNLLKQRGDLRTELDAYIADNNLSPYRETHAEIFLDRLCDSANDIVARVAQFERALIHVKRGHGVRSVLTWNKDPLPLLLSLAKDAPFEEAICEDGIYEIVVTREAAGFFEVFRVA
jgi:hypothetical protein